MNNKLKLTLVLVLVALVGVGLTACDMADSDEVASEGNLVVANPESVDHIAYLGLGLQAYKMKVVLEETDQATIEVENARFADTKESSITVKSGETVLFFTQDSLESINISGEGLADDVSVGLSPAGEGEAIPLDSDSGAINGWFVEDNGDWYYYSYEHLFEDFDNVLDFFIDHLFATWRAYREGDDLEYHEAPYIVFFANEDGEVASYAQWLAEGEDAYAEKTREDFAALIDSEEYYDIEREETVTIVEPEEYTLTVDKVGEGEIEKDDEVAQGEESVDFFATLKNDDVKGKDIVFVIDEEASVELAEGTGFEMDEEIATSITVATDEAGVAVAELFLGEEQKAGEIHVDAYLAIDEDIEDSIFVEVTQVADVLSILEPQN